MIKPTKIINELRKRGDIIELVTLRDGHGIGWKIKSTDVTGSIPLNSHGAINLPAAITKLNRALRAAGIDLEF